MTVAKEQEREETDNDGRGGGFRSGHHQCRSGLIVVGRDWGQ